MEMTGKKEARGGGVIGKGVLFQIVPAKKNTRRANILQGTGVTPEEKRKIYESTTIYFNRNGF